MSDIYTDSVYVQIKLPCKKRLTSPLTSHHHIRLYSAIHVGSHRKIQDRR